ncbi:hypothetical protein N9L86_02045 [Euryarchaeota archaeon]|nr:hypothetical protein [Euryarchaeota archaeon]
MDCMDDLIKFKSQITTLIVKEQYEAITSLIFNYSSTNNLLCLMHIFSALEDNENNFSLTYEQITDLVINSEHESIREACWIFDKYCNDVRIYDLCYSLIAKNDWSLCHYEGGNPLDIVGFHDEKVTKEEHIRYFISKINDYEKISPDELRYYSSLLASSKSPKFSKIVFEAMNESLNNKIGMGRTGEWLRACPSRILLKILELNPHEESIHLAIEYLDQIWNSEHNSSVIRTIVFQLLEILAAIPTKESLNFLTVDLSWWAKYFSEDYQHISDRWEVFQLTNMSYIFEELADVSIENLEDEIHLKPLLGETYELLIDDFPLRDIRGEDLDNLEVLEEAFLLKWGNEGSIYNFPMELFDIDDLCDLSGIVDGAQEISEIRKSNYFALDFCDFRKWDFDITY